MRTYTAFLSMYAAVFALCGTISANLDSRAEPHVDNAMVTLFGTVQRIINDREFVVRDNIGTVYVRVGHGHGVVLNEGDSVSVTGIESDSQVVDAFSIYRHQRGAS